MESGKIWGSVGKERSGWGEEEFSEWRKKFWFLENKDKKLI